MSLATRLLGANPGVQVSSALSGSLTTPGAKSAYVEADYYAIQTLSSNGSTTSFEFTSIPQTYSYLEIRGFGAATSATGAYRNVALRFNSDTGNNYNYRWVTSNNNLVSAAYTNSGSHLPILQSFPYGSQMGIAYFIIDNYTSATKAKTVLSYGGASQSTGTEGEISQGLGTWYGTPAAITTVTVLNTSGNAWTSGTTFTLYGVK